MMNCHGDFVPGGGHGGDQHNTANSHHAEGDTQGSHDAHHDDSAEGSANHAEESLTISLPGDVELEAHKGGIEDQLIAFVEKGYEDISEDSLKKIWFDFDHINFNTGSAVLTPESQHQVDNLAAILKAYPALKLKIGGYTDKTGDESVNKKISSDRAGAVKTALEKAGVGTQVTGAEGYGSDFAKYAADAPEADRVKDRRIAVRISK